MVMHDITTIEIQHNTRSNIMNGYHSMNTKAKSTEDNCGVIVVINVKAESDTPTPPPRVVKANERRIQNMHVQAKA